MLKLHKSSNVIFRSILTLPALPIQLREKILDPPQKKHNVIKTHFVDIVLQRPYLFDIT